MVYYDYIDVSNMTFLQYEGRGTAQSFWLQDQYGTRYLWKHEYSEDYLFNEVISYHLAKQMGLLSAECRLAAYNGIKGVLSKDVDYYGCRMRNIIEVYPDFQLLAGNCYSINSFIQCIQVPAKAPVKMSYKNVINLLLFDFLIENVDRHYGNIGVDSKTGDIAPFYDNAASLSLAGIPKRSLLFDEVKNEAIFNIEIPNHLAEHLGNVFLTAGSIFYKSYTTVDLYEILIPFEKLMGRLKHQEYLDVLPTILNARIQTLQNTIKSMI